VFSATEACPSPAKIVTAWSSVWNVLIVHVGMPYTWHGHRCSSRLHCMPACSVHRCAASTALPITQAPAAGSGEQAVLEDDDFEAKMAAIVERDYFPDIKQLQNKLEWTLASESSDPEQLAAVQRNITLRRAGYSVPLHAKLVEPPQTGSTTRSGTGLASASVRSSHSPAPSQQGSAQALPAGAVMPPPFSVASFAAAHTTEDQASLEEIFTAEAARRRERLAWMYAESVRTEAQAKPAAERLAGAQGGAAAQPAQVAWHHTPKSALYIIPDQHLELSSAERALMPTGDAPATIARNTRFRSADKERGAGAAGGSVATPSTIPSTELSPTSSAAAEGSTRGGRAGGEPQIGGGRGYTRLSTPSPSPGMAGTPIMTWGEVAGTPQQLAGDTPASGAHGDEGGGRAFIGAELSKAERVARSASRAMASQRLVQKRSVPHGHKQ
jgi:protein DGCR14